VKYLEHHEQVYVPVKTRTKRIETKFQTNKLSKIFTNREAEASETRRGSSGRITAVGIMTVIKMMVPVTSMVVIRVVSIKKRVGF